MSQPKTIEEFWEQICGTMFDEGDQPTDPMARAETILKCWEQLLEAGFDSGSASSTDLLRLVKEPRLAYAMMAALGRVTSPDGHHHVLVSSLELPSIADLRKFFPTVYPEHFSRPWKYHESCTDLAPGARDFFPKKFDPEATTSDILAWAGANGHRPATHVESVHFGIAHPEYQLWTSPYDGIVALGSHSSHNGTPTFAILGRNEDGVRSLSCILARPSWERGFRFLLVRQ